MSYVVRLFDARSRGTTAGKVCWLRSPADDRVFARMRERAYVFASRGQAALAVDRLPALYQATVEAGIP